MDDSHARFAPTDTQLLRRSCEALLGISEGLLADGDLNDDEIKFLNVWLEDNEDIAATWPGRVVYARIRDVLADGVITEDEREHLRQTLKDLIAGTLEDEPAASGEPEELPIDDVDSISIADRAFCFAGGFLYGTHLACERAVRERGGAFVPAVGPDVDYLVIGTLAGHDWADTTHGEKIEQARNHKQKGAPITIISEEQWLQFL